MKITFYILVLSTLLASCNSSTKGNWSEADKKQAREAINLSSNDYEYLGEDKNEFTECFLEKVENEFSSYKMANMDTKGRKALWDSCMDELIEDSESELGNWSEKDLEKLKIIFESYKENSGDLSPEMVETFLECYSIKVINNFPSYFATDNDTEGCRRLSEECWEELDNQASDIILDSE